MAEIGAGVIGAAATLYGVTHNSLSGFVHRHEQSYDAQLRETRRISDDLERSEGGFGDEDTEVFKEKLACARLAAKRYFEAIAEYKETSAINIFKKKALRTKVRLAKRELRRRNRDMEDEWDSVSEASSDASSITATSGSPPGSNLRVVDIESWISDAIESVEDDRDGGIDEGELVSLTDDDGEDESHSVPRTENSGAETRDETLEHETVSPNPSASSSTTDGEYQHSVTAQSPHMTRIAAKNSLSVHSLFQGTPSPSTTTIHPPPPPPAAESFHHSRSFVPASAKARPWHHDPQPIPFRPTPPTYRKFGSGQGARQTSVDARTPRAMAWDAPTPRAMACQDAPTPRAMAWDAPTPRARVVDSSASVW